MSGRGPAAQLSGIRQRLLGRFLPWKAEQGIDPAAEMWAYFRRFSS